MAKIYFEKRQSVKPGTTKRTPVVSTYHITLGKQRLAVRATHHDLLDMLPGILSEGGRIAQVCRQEQPA